MFARWLLQRLNIVLLLTLVAAFDLTAEVHGQCVDSSVVNNFKVRSVKLEVLFGLLPADLGRRLAGHHGDLYSAQLASTYEREVTQYLTGNTVQQRYERLIANNLKLSASARLVTLKCVEQPPPEECQASFAVESGPPTTECVDVTLKAYSVNIDVLNSSPYVLPLPRTSLAALYGAMPRPLLLLNPGFNVVQDALLGPAAAFNTSTDLLHLKSVLRGVDAKDAIGTSSSEPKSGNAASVDDPLEIETFNPAPRAPMAAPAAAQDDEPFVPVKLLLNVNGRKSLSKNFYDTTSSLVFSRTMPADFLQRIAVNAQFDASRLPQGSGDFLRNGASVGLETDLHLNKGPLQLISLGGRYRWSRNRFTGVQGAIPSETSTENGFEARAAADGVIKKGLFRASAWIDRAALEHGGGSYGRAAVLAGYGKDISIPQKKDYSRKIRVDGNECYAIYAKDPIKSQQVFGLEVLAGAGQAWGDTPEYARFFGGSELGSFLYDDLSSPDLSRIPFGPILRASKLKQAGVVVGSGPQRGGTSYWHGNLNLSIPIPKLSYPLIPHDWVTTKVVRQGDPEVLAGVPAGQRVCVNLRQMVKNAVRVSGKELLIAQLSRDKLSDQQKDALRLQGLSDLTPQQQAELQAALDAYAHNKVVAGTAVNELFGREIFPVTDFIADHANFFAIKPLLMFDAGRNRLRGSIDDRTRYNAGGGLQLDIVLARIELGYVAALNRLPGDGRGNFVARLVIKRFF